MISWTGAHSRSHSRGRPKTETQDADFKLSFLARYPYDDFEKIDCPRSWGGAACNH